MLATKARDTLEWWALVTVKHHPFLNRFFGPLDFLRNLGMLLGLPLGLLSLIIASLYLTFRFRRVNRGYRIAFVICNVLTIAGMWGILSILNQR